MRWLPIGARRALVKLGLVTPPSRCSFCGGSEGRIVQAPLASICAACIAAAPGVLAGTGLRSPLTRRPAVEARCKFCREPPREPQQNLCGLEAIICPPCLALASDVLREQQP